MPDADKILEAEKSIQNIASELKRMRDAADILQDAQQKSEAVITAGKKIIDAAQKVVLTTERFSGECEAIVAKLAAADLGKKLETLQKLHGEVAAAKTELVEKLGTTQEEVQSLIVKSITSLNSAIAKLLAQVVSLHTLHEKAAKGARTILNTILFFSILTFMVVTAFLILRLVSGASH